MRSAAVLHKLRSFSDPLETTNDPRLCATRTLEGFLKFLAFLNIQHTRLLPPYYGDAPTKTFNIFSRNMTFPPGHLQASCYCRSHVCAF